MSFGHPLLLLTLLVLPLAWLGRLLAERRRTRYAVRFTNVDVLAGVVGSPSRLRLVAPALLAVTLATLAVAVARPYVTTVAASDKAAVILVLDVSGSMHAQDVKPTRLGAARHAVHTFLAKVPDRVRVGLILFAGDAVVATPPTADHALVGRAVDSTSGVDPTGTAIGDALALAVRLGQQVSETGLSPQTLGRRSLTAHAAAARRPLVSILFLSDGHQNRGRLRPLRAAQRAKAAGFPVYTVALGTTSKTRARGTGGGFLDGGVSGRGVLVTVNGVAPDPVTLRRIAIKTGGRFFLAQSAGALQAAYSRLGSRLGRVRAREEVTADFAAGAVLLLLLAGLASALSAPRLP